MFVKGRVSFVGKLIFAIAFLVSVWFLGTRFLSTSVTSASDALPDLTFQSPIPPVNDPDLNLISSVDNDAPLPGDEITYTLVYSTITPGSIAYNIRLYDFLPDGVTFRSASPSATHSDDVVLFTDSSAGPDNVTATVRVRVKRGYTQLHNHAMVMADYLDPAQDSLLTSVEQPPLRLEVEKAGPSAVLVGADMVYELHCENIDDSTVNNVTVVDVLPSGSTLVGASLTPEDMSLPVLRWSVGELAPAETWEAIITVTAPSVSGRITNTALVDGQESVITQTVFATEVVTQAAILDVSKSASASVVDVGDELVYTIRYRSTGNLTATSVLLTDTLPVDVNVVDVFPDTVLSTTEQLVWELGSLNPGVSGKVFVTTTVGGSADRVLRNEVDITGQPGSYPDHAQWETRIRPLKLYLPLVLRGYSTEG
jgi:uncharacterized repeat protein (TIGR01451 family)